jgi:hypothetical protein
MSNFKLAQWIPKYLRWYRFAYGPKLTLTDLGQQSPVQPSHAMVDPAIDEPAAPSAARGA